MLKYYARDIIRGNTLIKLYKPKRFSKPANLIDVPSAWLGLEEIVEDILTSFNIKRDSCIEFGVEFGYSAVVFSNFFKKVTGVDTFEGDIHTTDKGDHFEKTKENLSKFKNIQLIKSDYQHYIQNNEQRFDFAHVDIVHEYKETFECGLWAATHSSCTIFHDTDEFPEVRRAVIDIQKATGFRLYNYPKCHGLGILVKQ